MVNDLRTWNLRSIRNSSDIVGGEGWKITAHLRKMETVEAQKKKKRKEERFSKMEGHGGSVLWNSTGWKRDAPRSIPMFPTFFVHPRGDVLIRRVQSTGSLRFHWTLTFYAHLIPSSSTLIPPAAAVSIIHCFQVKTTSRRSTVVVSENKNLFSNFALFSLYIPLNFLSNFLYLSVIFLFSKQF